MPILLIEDSPDILEVLTFLLQQEGYTVHPFSDAAAALRELAGGLKPSLIVLDLHMPGMDGYCLAENILSHAEYRSIPIVAFSCYDLTRFKQRAMRAGMADFIPKPVDRARLLATIKDQLRLRKRLSRLSAIEDELQGVGAAPESPETVCH